MAHQESKDIEITTSKHYFDGSFLSQSNQFSKFDAAFDQ